MPAEPLGRILVAGANGRLGRHILHALGTARAIAGTRRGPPPDTEFEHVRLAPKTLGDRHVFDGVGSVINAVGAVSGTDEVLTAANVDYAVNLARAARDSGVARFVQVSSFAVYGAVETIDIDTPERPISAYGRTKAAGDRQLIALARDRFSIACVRIPFLFGPEHPALIGQLLKVGRRLPIFPVNLSAKRSMLTYTHAARILIDVADDDWTGVVNAADPQPFDFTLLNRSVLAAGGRELAFIDAARPIAAVLRRAAPTLHRRLFQSNFLSPRANIAGPPLRDHSIEHAVRAIVHASV